MIAFDPAGVARGYLLLPAAPRDRVGPVATAVEAAADSWPAALALLRYHAAQAPEAPQLRWPLPPDGVTYYHLADHLPLRSETNSRPDAGLMARLGDLTALRDGRRLATQPPGALTVRLPPSALTRLIFGYRPVSHEIQAGQADMPIDVIEPLAALFPTGTAWYPASNRC
jgi:hypothetical protein